ncbi:hypothetical protein AAG906_016519 [Vitis piasezkii]
MPEVRSMGCHPVSVGDLLHVAPYCSQTEVKSEPSVKKPPQHRCNIVQGTIKALLQPKIKEKHHSQLAWLQQRCGESYKVEKQFKHVVSSRSQSSLHTCYSMGGLPGFFFFLVIVYIYLFSCSIFYGSSFIGLISSISAGNPEWKYHNERVGESRHGPKKKTKLIECINKWKTECQTKITMARSSSSCRRDGNIWRISIEFAAWS